MAKRASRLKRHCAVLLPANLTGDGTLPVALPAYVGNRIRPSSTVEIAGIKEQGGRAVAFRWGCVPNNKLIEKPSPFGGESVYRVNVKLLSVIGFASDSAETPTEFTSEEARKTCATGDLILVTITVTIPAGSAEEPEIIEEFEIEGMLYDIP